MRLMRINEFAKLCGCTCHTLRYYDEINLLKPVYVNDKSNYRYYNENQVDLFKEIREFQLIGFNVKEISKFYLLTHQEIASLILIKIEDMEGVLERANILKVKYLGK